MFISFKCLNKNLIFSYVKKKCFSSNNFKDFANFAFKNSSSNEDYDKSSYEKPSNKDFSKVNSLIYNKRINLTNIFKNELQYFKLEADFEVNELRKRYLTLAKLYHPDLVKSDQDANFKFNKLQNSYERLKTYHELRIELISLESEYLSKGDLSVDSKIRFEEINQDFFNSRESEVFGNVRKEDYIKQLLIEDEFGDFREPKHSIHFLIFTWLIVGLIVFYIDIRKYYIHLQTKRKGVKYE